MFLGTRHMQPLNDSGHDSTVADSIAAAQLARARHNRLATGLHYTASETGGPSWPHRPSDETGRAAFGTHSWYPRPPVTLRNVQVQQKEPPVQAVLERERRDSNPRPPA